MPFYSIKDSSFPFIVLENDVNPLSWDHGLLFLHKVGSQFLRVTERGLQVVTGGGGLKSMSDKWHAAICNPSREGMCQEVDSGRMLYFPDKIVNLPDDFNFLTPNAYLQHIEKGVNGSACSNPHSNRQISIGDDRYEVSLCDIFDSSLDVVLDASNNMVYWRQNETVFWFYLLLALCAIYLVSCISQNIVSVFEGGQNWHNASEKEKVQHEKEHRTTHYGDYMVKNEESSAWTHRVQYFVISISLLCMLVEQYLTDNWCFVLSRHDWELLIHAYIYVSVLLLANMLDRGINHEHNISIITVTLIIFAMRIHFTFDNPYALILSTMYCIRSFFKLLNYFMHVKISESAMQGVLIFLDNLLLISIFENGLTTTYQTSFLSSNMKLIVITVGLLSSSLLLQYRRVDDVDF